MATCPAHLTGRLSRGLVLVVGCNRWCYRVLAHAALLRDEYPPVRLDAGGSEPAQAVA
jgi:hypothetical protein